MAGWVGLSVSALPVVLPVSFIVDDGHVLFRTSEGTKLAAASGGAVHQVCGWSLASSTMPRLLA